MKDKKDRIIAELKAEVALGIDFRNHILEESVERGKAINILIETIETENLTRVLAELYDLRMGKKKEAKP